MSARPSPGGLARQLDRDAAVRAPGPDRLHEAVGWLLDHGSAAAAGAAERLLTAVLEAAERLAARPLLGRRRPDLLPDPFRFWSIPRHGLVLVYRPEPVGAVVLRVLRASRDFGPLLDELGSDLDEPGPAQAGPAQG